MGLALGLLAHGAALVEASLPQGAAVLAQRADLLVPEGGAVLAPMQALQALDTS